MCQEELKKKKDSEGEEEEAKEKNAIKLFGCGNKKTRSARFLVESPLFLLLRRLLSI